MAREELVSSAVTFLQDPSVASSPAEKKIAFLQSKNLTQEEIDLALSRASEEPSAPAASPQQYPSPQHQPYRASSSLTGYGYPPYGQWQLPPELPKRDWRDWFIMATVMGGVGYGLYFIAKRYITPLIAPPTPAQLEQDKEHVDEQFSRAFTLIEQLSTDTASLKSAEEARTERLDTALKEVEAVIGDLKSSARRKEDDIRRISDEIRSLKDSIPKALEGAREGNENRLRELGSELKSLKVLLGNRLAGSSGISSPAASKVRSSTSESAASRQTDDVVSSAAAVPGPASATVPPAEQEPTSAPGTQTTPAPSASTSSNNSPLQLGRSASIPAWQMAAARRTHGGSQSVSDPVGVIDNTSTGSEQQSGVAK